jgi:subtilisin family serine protease
MHGRPARRLLLAAALASALLAVAVVGPATGANGQSARRAKAGSILVGFNTGVSAPAQADALADAGAKPAKRFPPIRGALVTVAPGATAQAIEELNRDPRVAYAEPNFILHAADVIPNDPLFSRLWGLHNTGQNVNFTTGTPDADIDAPEAWSVSTGSPDVTVAVIDTGVDTAHPDLAPNSWVNAGEDCAGCRTNGLDDDGNGYVDDWRGWDFANGDNNPTDDNGHGTHVAGTVAATGNNGLGVAGVTWSSRIMPLKFLGADGSGTTDDAISAILYARAKGVQILNNSWGGGEVSQALLDAIQQTDASGELFVAAAGNDFTNTDLEPFYPASYDVPNVLVVGASDQFDRKAWFSNYGTRTVDLSAPGTNVYSTWPGASYRFADGTSMATPQVSGAAALAKAVFPDASGVGLKALLLRDVDPLAALNAASRTAGRLNVDHAARCAGAPQAWIDAPANGTELSAGEPLEIRAVGVLCGSSSGVSVSATLNGTAFPLQPRGDGLYTATHVPQAGAVNLTVTATAGAASDVQSVTAMANQTYPIVAGGSPVTITTRSAGENAWLAFDGQADQRIALRMSGVTIGPSPCCSTYVSILKPDGTALGAQTLVGTNGGFVDTRTLPATGRYRILVDPQATATGSMTLTLYDVPGDSTATITPGGEPVTVTTGPVPGQNALVTFSGAQNQRIALKLSNVTIGTSTCCSARVSITSPDLSTLVYATPVGRNGGFLDAKVLPQTGTYTIFVDPQLADVGSMTLTLYDVPPDLTGTIAVGGGPVSLTLAPTPGQNATLTFNGTAAQRVSLRLSNVTIGNTSCCGAKISMLKPDGTTVVPPILVGTFGATITATLPVTGTYSIGIDPQQAYVGGITLTLSPA